MPIHIMNKIRCLNMVVCSTYVEASEQLLYCVFCVMVTVYVVLDMV